MTSLANDYPGHDQVIGWFKTARLQTLNERPSTRATSRRTAGAAATSFSKGQAIADT